MCYNNIVLSLPLNPDILIMKSDHCAMQHSHQHTHALNSYCHIMEYGKAEANLVKLSIFNPNNAVRAVLPRISPVGQPVTSIDINISGQRRP